VTLKRLELALWTGTIVIVVTGFVHWRAAAAPTLAPVVGFSVGSARDISKWPRTELVAASGIISGGNPFRIDRKPSSVIFGATAPASFGTYVPPKPPTAPLKVSGIIGGPPWAAVVEGFPGREGGVLVRGGDVINSFKIHRVGRDTVVVIGTDTTWKLTVRRAW